MLAGWVVRAEVQSELIQGASAFWARQVPKIMAVLRYLVPPIVAIVLYFSLRETIGAIAGFFAG